MKKPAFLLFFLMGCSCWSLPLHAQVRDQFRSNFLSIDLSHIASTTSGIQVVSDAERIAQAIGSMYLLPEWLPGNLILNNDTLVEGLFFRYNIYVKQMQFLYGQDTLALTIPDKVKYISFNNMVFVYTSYLNEFSLQDDYFQVLVDGPLRLLLHRKVKFEPKNPPTTPYSAGTEKDQFVCFENFYLQQEGQAAKLVDKSKHTFLDQFTHKRNELKAFMKREKCKLRRQEDLVKIVNYYNALQ